MVPAAPQLIAAPQGARCSLHPDRPALLVCHRCGAFICEEDQRPLDRDIYCPTCVARPDVDYLEAFRLKYWGVRDSWAWLFGAGGLVNAAIAIGLVSNASWAAAGAFGLSAVVGIAFCAGVRWARYGPLAFAILLLVFCVLGAALSRSDGDAFFGGSISAGFAVFIGLGVFLDTRNRLFFKVPVSRRALQKSWHLYANNTIARQGFQLAFLGLIVPGVALIALVMSIIGLRRVDSNAHPPIGRRGQAIAGIALSAITLLLSAVVVFYNLVLEG